MTKPFDVGVLLARVKAVLRRSQLQGRPTGPVAADSSPTLRVGELAINPAAVEVTLREQPLQLSPREFDLLHVLMLAGGRVLTREQIEQQLYGWGREIDSNSIEVHVHHLRRKLGPATIQTVRGVGYAMAPC